MANLKPPLPRALRPKPKGPSEDNGHAKPTRKEKAAEKGISVVDWVDERTSVSYTHLTLPTICSV